jgi:DNA-binding NarL/FixJ family response regulator
MRRASQTEQREALREPDVVGVLDVDGRPLVPSGQTSDRFWCGLVAGQLHLVERAAGTERCFLVVSDGTPLGRPRPLSASEIAVVRMAVRGETAKLIASALGISAARVSSRLASAAAKLGAGSRTNLLRLASAMTGGDARAEVATNSLTRAERAVLDLVQQGLSNAAIAKARRRSVRTIANQVASILRKTNAWSRRELVVRPRLGAAVPAQ